MSRFAKKIVAAFSTAAVAFSSLLVAAPAFAAAHAVGTNVKSADGTVWMIMPANCRRAYTSEGAFLSYGFNNWGSVQVANADDLALPVCPEGFIPPQDGGIIFSDRGADKGTGYVISEGKKYGFPTEAIFYAQGYTYAWAKWADVSWMTTGGVINDGAQAHLPGTLVNNNGTVQFVDTNGLRGFPTPSVFSSWGYNFGMVVPANTADKAKSQVSVLGDRMAGYLSPTGGTANPPSTGSMVTVSAGMMPAAATLPTGANSVKVGEFTFMAPSNGSITLSGLTVKRTGVGSTSDITNAYIYDGSSRLTSGRTFNSQSNETTFSLSVMIPAGSSKTLALYVSFATNAGTGAVHSFELTSASSVNATGATATGSFPVKTNSFTISGTAAGTLSIEKNGSLSNPRVGDREVKVSEFKLSATTEDAWVNWLTLSQGGNITNTALTNFKLKQNGVVVATASSINAQSRLPLVFSSPFKIERGNNRVFELYADVDGRPADTISFYVEEVGDVSATGATYNAGMTISLNANFDQSGDTGLTLTLQGGNLTVTFTGPSSRNISNTANDVSIWEGSIFSANAVEVRHWRVRVTDTTAADPDLSDASPLAGNQVLAAIQDVKIWNADTNQVIAGPKEFTVGDDNTDQTFDMADTVNLAAGSTTKIKITVDVRNNPTGNISLVGYLNAFQSNDIKNANNNTFLTPATDISPNAAITGQTQTVTAGGLTLTTAPSPTDQTIVKGAQNVEALAINFSAGSGDSIKVNSLTITAGAGDTANSYGASGAAQGGSATVNDMVLSVKLMDGQTPVGNAKSFSSGTATFDNLNWTIPASQTKKLSVVINTNSAATLNGSSDFLRLAVYSPNVTAVDSQGNTVTPSGYPINDNDTTTTDGTGTDTVVTVASGGTLTASLASEPENPASGLITSGTTDKVLAAFKFEAVQDSFLVKKFVLLPYVSGSNSAASNDRIAQLKVRYKNQAGTTVVQTVGLSGTSNNVDISANPMYVAQNSSAVLEVLGDIANFGLQDGTEDENITFALKNADSTNNQATGLGSNSDVASGDFDTGSTTDFVGNRHNVYRTVLTVAKGATTSSNTARAASQNIASIALTSSTGASNAIFRGSKRAVDGATTGWVGTGVGAAATSSTAVSGTSSLSFTEDGTSAVADHFDYDFGASAGLNNYNRLNFNIRASCAKGAGDLVVHWSTDVDATDNAALNITSQGNSNIPALTTNTWQNVDVAWTGVTSATRYITFNVAANPDNNCVLLVDDLRAYNDSINLDLAGSLNSTTTTSNGTRVDLKTSGGTIKAYGPVSGATASAGTALLIPGDGSTDVTSITVTSDIQVTTSAQTLDVVTNTINLMASDTTANETLSVSWDTGTVTSAGDFRWYDNSDTAAGNNQAGITVVGPTSSTQTFTHNY